MTHYSFYANLLICILWIANTNQRGSTFGQNMSYSTFTNSFSFPYSIVKSGNSTSASQECNVSATENFTILVRKSLHGRGNFEISTLQELMVRGFEILCSWTHPTREKFRIQSQLKSDNLLHLNAIAISAEYGRIDFHNVTLNQFPNRDKKVLTNPLNEKCAHIFETTYYAKSNETTIQGEMLANGTRVEFILIYQNVTLTLKDIKMGTQTGRIFSERTKMEYNFDAFVAHTTNPQNVHSLLDSVTRSLLDEIIAQDPSRRLAFAAVQQDVEIADFYRRDVLRLMSSVLMRYVRTRYRQPCRFPVDHARSLSESIQYVQIDGLDRCKVCDSNMQLVPRARNIAMKLKFSINFNEGGDQIQLTNLTILERSPAPHNRTVVVKKLLVQLEFSSSMQLETSQKHHFHFHLTAVKVEIAQAAKYRSAWYESFKPKLSAIFSEILTEIVLSWMLYETN